VLILPVATAGVGRIFSIMNFVNNKLRSKMGLTGWAWAQILQPPKKILDWARPEMLFLAILHNKMHRWPAKPGPEPGQKLRPDAPLGWSWAGFSQPEINGFFWFAPNPARPARDGADRKSARSFEAQMAAHAEAQCRSAPCLKICLHFVQLKNMATACGFSWFAQNVQNSTQFHG
jgi:hypothetical protein